ncbi:S1C family serine protease, partial [Schaalia naturae]
SSGGWSSGQPDAAQPAPGQQTWPGASYQQYQQAAAPSSPFATATRTRPARSHGAPGWLALLVAMVVTALIAVGGTYALVGGRSSGDSSSTTGGSTGAQTTQSVPQVTSSGDAVDWEAVADAVGPATVTITVDSNSSEEIGSGVVYDADGHIVTNYHVISSAVGGTGAKITVTMSDSTLYTATVVGYDQTTDLAVLQLENPPSDLTVARFGSSADLTVGQSVMAIGSPLGLSATVTTGIVSALDRPVEVATESQNEQQVDPNDPFGQLQGNENQSSTASSSVITNAIQVDASINPGNSGGPLFDSSGSVIGINSSIASMSDSSSSSSGSIGLGFAIPADLVVSVADQLISTGSVDHAVLGVTIQSGTATVDGTTRLGAQVVSVNDGGAAAEAGLQEGDIILSIDGDAVTSGKALSGYVRTYTGGSQVQVEFARDGKTQTVTVTLDSQQD